MDNKNGKNVIYNIDIMIFILFLSFCFSEISIFVSCKKSYLHGLHLF